MKDLMYSELLETLKISSEPVIVVIDELYQNKKKIAAGLAADSCFANTLARSFAKNASGRIFHIR